MLSGILPFFKFNTVFFYGLEENDYGQYEPVECFFAFRRWQCLPFNQSLHILALISQSGCGTELYLSEA
jgi:hypothetical protein